MGDSDGVVSKGLLKICGFPFVFLCSHLKKGTLKARHPQIGGAKFVNRTRDLYVELVVFDFRDGLPV